MTNQTIPPAAQLTEGPIELPTGQIRFTGIIYGSKVHAVVSREPRETDDEIRQRAIDQIEAFAAHHLSPEAIQKAS